MKKLFTMFLTSTLLLSACGGNDDEEKHAFKIISDENIGNYTIQELEHIDSTCRYIRTSDKGITPSLVQPETCKINLYRQQ